MTGEFPRIDDRRAGLKSSQGWYACANPDLPMFGALSGIVHVDGNGKRLGNYLLPAGDTISEPVFVERGSDAAEGDGWLLSAVWRARENRSDLAVFNAGDVVSRSRGAGTSRPSRARRFSWQLGGGAVSCADEPSTHVRHSGMRLLAQARNP